MSTVEIHDPPLSHVPYRPATVGDVLHSDWTKARTVASTRWTLLVAAALGIGVGALISGLAADQYAKNTPGSRTLWDPTSISGGGLALAQLAIGILGVLLMTSEYSTRSIGISLAAVPRRSRLLAAKAVVVVVLTLVVAEIITFIAFFIGQAIISGQAPTASLGQHGVLRALIGCGLYGCLIALFGLALGAILRHAAGSIAVLVAVLYVLPGVFAALPASIEHSVEKYWPTEAGQQVTVVVRTAPTLSPWAGFGVMFVFTAVVLAGAFSLLNRRDA